MQPPAAAMQVFINNGHGPIGPFTVERVRELIRNGTVRTQTLISCGPNEQSLPAWQFEEFAPLLHPTGEVTPPKGIVRHVEGQRVPQVPQSVPRTTRDVVRTWLGISAAFIVVPLGLFYLGKLWIDATNKPATVPIVFESSADTPLPPPREPTIAETLGATKRVTDAVAVLYGHFKDTENEQDPSAFLLAAWSHHHLTWAELAAVEQTTRAKVMKDPDSERGKLLCKTGTIGEISVDRSAGMPIYEGGLVTPFGIVRFIAIHSTGDLVEHSAALFCGIVTGRYSYSNTMGGFTHAVRVVGMFDLPENRKWTVSK